MAVLDDVPGIKVVVLVAGNEATEYEDPNHEEAEEHESIPTPTSSKYIECISNAEFSIKAYVTRGYEWGYRNHCLSASFYVDGKRLRKHIHNADSGDRIHILGREVYDAATSQWLLQKCKFSAISTVDDAKDERIKKDIQIAKNLGVIEVSFTRCIKQEGPLPHRPTASAIKGADKIELAEKSLKGRAMSHGTAFSTVKNPRIPKFTHTRSLEEDGGPIATFRFHYRSRDALKQEMVIPRSPSPSSTPLAEMPRAELERLARERLDQLRSYEAKEEHKPAIKRELNKTIDLSDENPRPAKFARRAEVIDLTDA
ncbi:hypothetical protein GGR52DRAFT_522951 [Hypoxylon sp. FL1284]|nr:hypothetical protein GGR52DRAFT_522951 [Hypoxylon sp. FL1284]